MNHIIELVLSLRAEVARELGMNMRSLQVFILFHVLYHHPDVILTAVRRSCTLGSTNNAA